MNILSTLQRIIAGPLFVPTLYGDYLGFPFGFILFSYSSINPWMVAATAIGLYPVLNYYHLATGMLVKNGIMQEASHEMIQTVKKIADQEKITVVRITEITNFTSPTILIGRFKSNTEVCISSHWNTETSHKALVIMLHDSFKSINKIMYRLFISSSLFAAQTLIQTAVFVILRNMYGFNFTSITATLFLWQLCGWYTLFLKTYIFSQLTLSSDLALAKQLGTQTIIEGLQEFNALTQFDKNLETIPEWALAIPKISSRIAALSQIKSQ